MRVKRIAALVLLALVFGSAHAAVSVRMDDAAALLNEDGAEIVSAGAYADIVSLGDGLFAASADGALFALMDENGSLRTEARYDEFRWEGGVLLARRDGTWGLMDRSGAELGAFEYARIEAEAEGACWAIREGEEADALLLLKADGSARDSGLPVQKIGEAAEGLLPVQIESGRWGCCDSDGRLAVPAEFDFVGRFISGRAAAVAGGRYGAIDRDGEWVVAPEYDFLEISERGFILAANRDAAYLLDADGGELAAYFEEDIYAAVVGAGYVIENGESLRIFDETGTLLEELAPDASVTEGVGEQLVISEGMWGETCVRLLGTETAYQNLYPLGTANGVAVYACLAVNAARYANDLLREIQISVDMDTARYGLVNAAGEQILPCRYVSMEYLSDDRLLVRTERQWQMIDSRGKVYWRRRVTQTEAPSF